MIYFLAEKMDRSRVIFLFFYPGDGQDVITDFSDRYDTIVYKGFSDTEL